MKDKYYLVVQDNLVVSHRITWNVDSMEEKDLHFCPVIFDNYEEAKEYAHHTHEIKEICLKDYNKNIYYSRKTDKRSKCLSKEEHNGL